ncbi:hypothetical protein CGZ93_01560 [Enemella dayhoffiae]|uniref:Uncharacterized protein n=1 Tax=Enemella dayhoffiae TaxID=2016507 RepID=A0A255HBT1_9ACTN|nr:hypothetical protein [Enemella dayhoffiae]OYO25169.1 hypothetical protein CGZ93_01560 [Enemella dayhoffiae]
MTQLRSQTQRGASAVSLVAGIVVVAAPLLGWLGHTDFTRTLMGVLIGAVVGLALGLLGPGVATSLTGLVGPPVRGLLVVVAAALLLWAVLGVAFDLNTVTKTVSIAAAAVLVAAWVPLSRLSGR